VKSNEVSLVVHLQSNQIAFVQSYGLMPLQLSSWGGSAFSKTALKKLLISTSLINQKVSVRNVVASFPLPEPDEKQNPLIPYFSTLFDWASKKAHSLSNKQPNSTPCLVINLMPFTFPPSVADKIIEGLRIHLKVNSDFNHSRIHIIFLTRNSDSFLTSKWYADTIENDEYNVRFSLLDYKGYHRDGLSNSQHSIPRILFRNLLAGDKEWFYNELIYRTNTYIGHFGLSNSHVRTHYDLEEFLRNDAIIEFLCAEIEDYAKEYSNILLVYQGIEYVALQRLASEINKYSELIVDFAEFSTEFAKNRFDDYGGVLILTDIVNSGITLKNMYEKVVRSYGYSSRVLCYTIIAMLNSPTSSDELPYRLAACIKRVYYRNNHEDCLLCQIQQPYFEVKRQQDFRQVHRNQLTPYDFWEMVFDCKALRAAEKEASGRVLTYRVETVEMLKKYRTWLSNVIRAKHRDLLPTSDITRILTVYEPGGKAFSKLLCDALQVSPDTVLAIPRSDLEKAEIASTKIERPNSLRGETILLADDGINQGHTIRMLANYARRHGGNTIAASVLDNRLGEMQLKRLQVTIGNILIISLYSWPGEVVQYTQGVLTI
jgi:hypoxanthine-guanine phosphoribosyltransferase